MLCSIASAGGRVDAGAFDRVEICREDFARRLRAFRCGNGGPLLRAAGYTTVTDTGVPVLDSTSISLKYLEAMTDISLKMGVVKSTRQLFKAPPKPIIAAARQSLNLI